MKKKNIFKNVIEEIKKIRFPKFKELLKTTGIVFAVILFSIAFFIGYDGLITIILMYLVK